MKFTLKQLQVFLAVAHRQSVSRAADELAMSQSAVSGALKDLESRYGIQLFDRIGKRLQLNTLGQQLRARAEALVAQAKELESEFSRHQIAGELRIGATLTIGNYLCIGLIEQYKRIAGGVRVVLDVANTETITEEILDFKIDLGMVEGEVQHPDLNIIPWRQDELVCVCAPGSPLARQAVLYPEDFPRVNWILREKGSGTRQTFDRAAHAFMSKLQIGLELQHTEAIKRAVMADMGLSCLSHIAVSDALARGDLVALETPMLDLKRTLYLLVHKNKYISGGIRSWLSVCESVNPAQK